jgi:hypothetical protein
MTTSFEKVKNYINDLGHSIVLENANDNLLIIEDERVGLKNFVLGCADPILIMEQHILDIPSADLATYQLLLRKNRDMIHGAFVLDDSGTKLIFRDTLQIASLDINELEGTINSLTLLLSEFSDELIEIARKN